MVAVDIFFTGRGCEPHPNQLGQPWTVTLVFLGERTLAAQKGGREAQMRRAGGGNELWEVEGTPHLERIPPFPPKKEARKL